MAWDTGASSRTKFLSSLRYLVSLEAVVFFLVCMSDNKNIRALSAATLDSAVTVGHYGAKNFLLRDRKEVIQCVFFENVSSGGWAFLETVKSLKLSHISVEYINENFKEILTMDNNSNQSIIVGNREWLNEELNNWWRLFPVNRSKNCLALSVVRSVAVWGTTTLGETSSCVFQSELLCRHSWGTHRRLWKRATQWCGRWSQHTVKSDSIWKMDLREAFECSSHMHRVT